MMLNKLLYLIIFLSGICLTSLSAQQINYWDLTPQGSFKSDNTILYVYPAKVLINRISKTQVEVLLQIKDGQNTQKNVQTWIKGNLGSVNASQFSMGDEVLVFIDPLHPEKLTIDGSFSFETVWTYNDNENWVILPDTTTNSSLTLQGVEYLIYPGEIVHLNYSTNIDYHYRAEHDGLEHQLEIDIQIAGSETKHYQDSRKFSTDLRYPEMNLGDIFIKQLRHWNLSDQIKVLVNKNFPGFWWIFNESRNEAILVAQGHPIEFTTDLWSKLGE